MRNNGTNGTTHRLKGGGRLADEFRVYAAKRYMAHVVTIRNGVRELQSEIDTLRDDLTGIRGVQYSDMPGSPNAYGDAIPDGIARLEELIGEYCTELAAWVDEQHEAHKALRSVEDGRYREILWAHYVKCDSWEQIAVDMHYSYEYVRKELFEAALDALYWTMPEQWRRDFPNAI